MNSKNEPLLKLEDFITKQAMRKYRDLKKKGLIVKNREMGGMSQ
jgi:hypothetical protein